MKKIIKKVVKKVVKVKKVKVVKPVVSDMVLGVISEKINEHLRDKKVYEGIHQTESVRSAEYIRVQKVYEALQKSDPELWERDKVVLLAILAPL